MRLAALLAALLVATVAQADKAIVVGVDQYRFIPPDRWLEGPENDAADMAEFCRSHGYELPDSRYLVGRKATADAIRAALREVQNGARKGERVIFYFAGHGMNHGTGAKPDCAILPYDFSPSKATSQIGVGELYAAVKAIRTGGNRTVVLDSCFSGGMARDIDGFRSRSYVLGMDRSVVPMLDNGQTQYAGPEATSEGGPDKICYLTAAKANEEALETEIDGKAHGLFTHALIPQLNKEETCGQTSAATQAAIAKILRAKGSFRRQTPDVTDAYRNLQALKETPNGPETPPAPTPKSVWEMIARENPDKRIRIVATPNRGDLRLGQAVRFKVYLDSPGYLVVLSSKDSVKVQSPLPPPGRRRYEAQWVQPTSDGYDLSPDGDLGKAFTQAGGNRVTAFLFTTKKPAQRLLDAFNANPEASVDDLAQGRGLVDLSDAGEGACYTSSLSFEVGAQILGGYEVRPEDAPALCDALLKPGGPFEMPFRNGAEDESLKALEEARKAKLAPPRLAELLTLCVNMTLDKLAARKKPKVWLDAAAATPKMREAAQKTEGKLATATTQDERVRLQAEFLASLLPQSIKKASP